jgi:hypothetical protein
MTCTQFQRKNYSDIILNQAINDDMGSWWWWTNAIGKKTILLFRKNITIQYVMMMTIASLIFTFVSSVLNKKTK